MSLYSTNEARFRVPDGWVDGTVNMLEPAADPDGVKLMVTRSLRGTGSLEGFARDDMRTLSQRLRWFKLLSEGWCGVGAERAHELRMSFREDENELYGRRVIVPADTKFVTLFVVGALRARSRCDDLFQSVIESAEIRVAKAGRHV